MAMLLPEFAVNPANQISTRPLIQQALSFEHDSVKQCHCGDFLLMLYDGNATVSLGERTSQGSTGFRSMIRSAKFQIGQVVKHRIYPFRGVVFDVDPVFDNTDEWYDAIPEEVRPSKDQPFYHLFAENEETEYIAYVSEQNLLLDDIDTPLRHPQIDEVFYRDGSGAYLVRDNLTH